MQPDDKLKNSDALFPVTSAHNFPPENEILDSAGEPSGDQVKAAESDSPFSDENKKSVFLYSSSADDIIYQSQFSLTQN